MERHQLLNSAAMLLPRPVDEAAFGKVRDTVRDLASLRAPRERPTGADLGRTLRFASDSVPRMVWRQRRIPPRTDAGWADLGGNSRRFGALSVEHQIEQIPDPDNRVSLAATTDDFGRPMAHLRWRWNPADLDSLSRTQVLLADAVRGAGIGTLEPEYWEDRPRLTTPSGAFHPMGATRMDADPHKGVVDAEGRVHGVSNLLVVGSSTFPTGGYANPTLTIVALALRMGALLRREARDRIKVVR